jgi:hypothetical protein
VDDDKQDVTSGGLEWVLPSPPAFHTFGDSLPVIRPTPVIVSKSIIHITNYILFLLFTIY